MPEPALSYDYLSDLIEGQAFAYGESSLEGELARLARSCREVAVPGPDVDSRRRLSRRLSRLLTAPQWRFWEGWVGPVTRPLAQRMAAGALVLAAAGGGASTAAGVPPDQLANDAVSFVRSIVVNLQPNRDGGEQGPQTVSSPTPAPSAPAAATTSPQPSPPAATPTPRQTPATPGARPTEDDDDSETRTPEPGDDNGGNGAGRTAESDDDASGPGSGS